MFGIILVTISAFFGEISDSIGKYEVTRKKESIYTMGFLSLFWGAIFYVASAIFKHSFIFSSASIPLFALRSVLEIFQIHITTLAIVKAERSSFSFIRAETIPLLLLADLALGYAIGPWQIAGILIIFLALLVLFLNHGLDRRGIGFVIFSTINAVITISLFKYDITHFNSVEAEQSIMAVILMVYLFLGAYFIARENPFVFLKKPLFSAQSITSGASSVLVAFAYTFAPASVITAANRSLAALWAVISGNIYFYEKKIILKLAVLLFIILGIFLLM